jgi:hypothetical protein
MLDRLPDRAPRRSLPPGWGAPHDNRLRDTGGRYREIAAMADDLGVETRVLIARHHRLRAERVPPVPEPVMGPAELAVRDLVTPMARVILREIESRGAATYAELELATGTQRQLIYKCLRRYELLLLDHGWRLRRSTKAGRAVVRFWLEAAA